MSETDLSQLTELLGAEGGLCVVADSRSDGTVAATVVNAGVLEHPVTGQPVVGFVSRGDARRLARLRVRPALTVTARSGWRWASAEGTAELVGPDDPADGVDAEGLRRLLRAVYTSAGGHHDDWDEYDRVMAAERRTAVLLAPTRVYSNRAG